MARVIMKGIVGVVWEVEVVDRANVLMEKGILEVVMVVADVMSVAVIRATKVPLLKATMSKCVECVVMRAKNFVFDEKVVNSQVICYLL
jgi:hypothetical protein